MQLEIYARIQFIAVQYCSPFLAFLWELFVKHAQNTELAFERRDLPQIRALMRKAQTNWCHSCSTGLL
jgi:hypothetical protein